MDPETQRTPRGGLRDWTRRRDAGKIAGVCAGLADQLELPVTAVRVAFVLLTVFHATGLVLYLALWFLMPPEPGAPSGLDRLVGAVTGLHEDVTHGHRRGYDGDERRP